MVHEYLPGLQTRPGQFSDYPYQDVEIPSSTHKTWNISISIFTPENVDFSRPAPVIIMAHGIGAIRFAGLQHFAVCFAKAGYFAIIFDYLYWGSSDGLPRNHMSVTQQVNDYKDVIKWVRAHASSANGTGQSFAWAPSSVAIWGTSFAGMHVTALLAEDQTLAAGIAQCPCVDGFAAGMKVSKSHLLRLSTYATRDIVGNRLGMKPYYVGLTDSGIPGRAAFMPGPEAVKGKENIIKTTQNLEPKVLDEISSALDKITARSMTGILLSRPVKKAKKITAPFLIVLPEYDNQAPLEAAKKVAELAVRGEVIHAQGGHFDIYYGCVGYDANIKGQLEFLARIFPR